MDKPKVNNVLPTVKEFIKAKGIKAYSMTYDEPGTGLVLNVNDNYYILICPVCYSENIRWRNWNKDDEPLHAKCENKHSTYSEDLIVLTKVKKGRSK